MTEECPISIKHNGTLHTIDFLLANKTIADLKKTIQEKTRVNPINQKIMGLKTKSGKPVTDDLMLSEINVKPNSKLMMIGSPDEVINEVNIVPEDLPEIIDDLDYDDEEELAIAERPEYLSKVKKRASQYEVTVVHKVREDKKLLVLDIDYTIFDHLTPAESVRDLMRPYLHEFLSKVWPYYDIAIWSATGMSWIKAKLSEMDLLPKNFNPGHSQPIEEQSEPFSVCMLLDSRAMITVEIPGTGVKEVKPLGVIWEQFNHWSPHNTIMFDDIRRNFIMNPQSGLRIRSYRHAPQNQCKDHELLDLAVYLELIADIEIDFCDLNHRKWRNYVNKKERKCATIINSHNTSKSNKSNDDDSKCDN